MRVSKRGQNKLTKVKAGFWLEFRKWAERLPTTVRADLDLTTSLYMLRGGSKPVLSKLTNFCEQALHTLIDSTSGDDPGNNRPGVAPVPRDSVQAFLHLLIPGRGDGRISIDPLAKGIATFCSAQMEYLTQGLANAHPPTSNQTPKDNAHGLSNVQAAKTNRQREIRLGIILALRRLRVSEDKWPDYVREYYANPERHPKYHQRVPVPLFQPPPFDKLNQSPEDWRKDADAAWEKHRNSFLKVCVYWIDAGVDEAIPAARRMRGVGEKARNASTDQRFEWAARRLIGSEWPDIAGSVFKADQVRKTTAKVLRDAGWSPNH